MRGKHVVGACIVQAVLLTSPAVADASFPFNAGTRTTCTARMFAPTVEFARWQVSAGGVHLEFATAGAAPWRLLLNNRNPARASTIVFTDGGAGPTGDGAPPIQVACVPSR